MSVLSPRRWRPAHWFALAAAIAALDLVTKEWASAALTLHQRVEVWPFFNFTLVHNPGAAFSFLADGGGAQRWFFIALTIILTGIIGWWLAHTRDRGWLSAALALVLGGAVGNLVDRVRFGYVVDFLDFHFAGWHWPAFNIADAAISCGAVLLIVITVMNRE